jgi:GNAT superfamily N-acetyltransferase
MLIDVTIARRLELSSAQRAIDFARTQQLTHSDPHIAVESVAGGYLVFAGAGLPLNRAKALGLGQTVSDKDLDFVEEFFRSRGAAARVELCPLADASLGQLLKERGYRFEQFYSALVRPLSEKIAEPGASEVRVCRVSEEDKEVWLDTVARGFSEHDTRTAEMVRLIESTFHSASAQCYLAWAGDQPAGGGAVLFHEGIAKLCSASTRVAFRKRGVQTALLNARLRAAQEAGCDLAHVLTAPGSASQRNVERSGFSLAYTKVVLAKE